MATLAQIRYDILNKLRSGRASDDDRISTRQIDFNIKQKRLLLLDQELRSSRKVDQKYLQTIPCLDLQLVDKSECCEIKTKCKILRTVDPIPNVANNLFNYIGPIDGSFNYQILSNTRARWSDNAPFTSHLPKAYYINNYLYITVEKLVEKLKVIAVFQDPADLGRAEVCGYECFNEDTTEFPLPTHLVDILIKEVLRDLEYMLKMGYDMTNNTVGDER